MEDFGRNGIGNATSSRNNFNGKKIQHECTWSLICSQAWGIATYGIVGNSLLYSTSTGRSSLLQGSPLLRVWLEAFQAIKGHAHLFSM
jgi:hypothetical protein